MRQPLRRSFITYFGCQWCYDLRSGIEPVAERGRNCRLAGQGAAAAVLGLEDAQVVAVLRTRMELFEAVNFNSIRSLLLLAIKRR